MKPVKQFNEFVNETTALQTKEVEVTKFPNPLGGAGKGE